MWFGGSESEGRFVMQNNANLTLKYHIYFYLFNPFLKEHIYNTIIAATEYSKWMVELSILYVFSVQCIEQNKTKSLIFILS